jgi:hypothetical protein
MRSINVEEAMVAGGGAVDEDGRYISPPPSWMLADQEYTFDDGSSLTVDQMGNPIGYTDTNGASWSPNGQACFNAVAASLAFIGAALRRNWSGAAGAGMVAADNWVQCVKGTP